MLLDTAGIKVQLAVYNLHVVKCYWTLFCISVILYASIKITN